MCGPSHQSEQLAGSSASLASTLSANYNQNFAAQSQILQSLTSQFEPIAQAGPDQQGFGANELASLNTTVGEGVGQNYAKAARALGTQLSAQGGGNEFLPTGAKASLKANLASSAANELSGEQLGIIQANYNQGRANWQNATAGLAAISNQYNPTALGSTAISGNSQAFNQADQIQQEKNQEQADIAGGITGLVGAGASFLGGAMGGGGFSGGLKALAG